MDETIACFYTRFTLPICLELMLCGDFKSQYTELVTLQAMTSSLAGRVFKASLVFVTFKIHLDFMYDV